MSKHRSIANRIVIGCGLAALFLFDLHLVSEADAILGARRRTAMVTAAVVQDEDEQKAAAAQQPAATAPAPATPPAPATGTLPIGTIVTALPPNCPEKTVNGVAYYQCGGNSYRAAFQGSTLVYVTTQP